MQEEPEWKLPEGSHGSGRFCLAFVLGCSLDQTFCMQLLSPSSIVIIPLSAVWCGGEHIVEETTLGPRQLLMQ